MHKAKIDFFREQRLLFRGGEVYQQQGNVEGGTNTNERGRAAMKVDALLRESTRARKTDGKLLYDRIEDIKKFLGQSKDSASEQLLSKINTAKEGIITEQEYFERGEKSQKNPDDVRAYEKPWNDLFTHLQNAEKLMKAAKESSVPTQKPVEKSTVSPQSVAHAKATIESHLKNWNAELFGNFRPANASGDVRKAYEDLVIVVTKWEAKEDQDKTKYDAAWIGLRDAMKDFRKAEKPLDDESGNKLKEPEKKNAAESKADPRDKLQKLSPDELKAWAEGQVNVLMRNKVSENFDMENLEDTERATRLLSAYESFAVTMQLWAKKSPYFSMEEYDDRWNKLRFRWSEYSKEQMQSVNQNPQAAAALKKAREMIKQDPVVSKMETLVKETQPNLRWGFISNQYIKNRIKMNDGKSHNSDDYVAAFKTEEFLKYVDGIVQQNVAGQAYIKNEQYIRKGELSGKYPKMPGSDDPLGMLQFILEHENTIGGVDFDNLKKYLDGRTE